MSDISYYVSLHYSTSVPQPFYLLDLVGLQEITGFFEVGFERFRLQLSFDGRAMLGVHLFLGGNLRVQIDVRDAQRWND